MNTILAIRENGVPDIEELRDRRKRLLAEVSAIGREIGTLEALEILADEHQAAEGGVTAPKDGATNAAPGKGSR